ncbi:MAG: peptide ABC transporter substrate-binding protein, partial [Erysipelothrix sp.]
MKRLFASLMSLAMAVALVGCGGGDSSSSSTTLRVGSGKDFANPDPAVVDDSVTANVLAQAYEGLYKLGKNGEVEPLLATALP